MPLSKIMMVGLMGLGLSFSAMADQVDYQFDDKNYQGYYTSPDKDKQAPLVLLIHDWDGLTEYEVKRAEMLREQGYAVFAIDLFGKGVRPTKDKDKRQHTGELYQDRARMRNLMHAGLEKAGDLGADTEQVVVVGYCFGGAAALEMARSGAELQGFVSFHGGLSLPEGQDYSRTQAEVLVLHGTADKAINMAQFATLAAQLEAHQVDHEMITYGGADHAFTVFDGNRYHPEADKKSWQQLLNFLDRKLN